MPCRWRRRQWRNTADRARLAAAHAIDKSGLIGEGADGQVGPGFALRVSQKRLPQTIGVLCGVERFQPAAVAADEFMRRMHRRLPVRDGNAEWLTEFVGVRGHAGTGSNERAASLAAARRAASVQMGRLAVIQLPLRRRWPPTSRRRQTTQNASGLRWHWFRRHAG